MKYRISLSKQICMSLRRSPVGKIKKELKKAERYNLDLDGSSLEAHFLASEDIKDLTDSMIFAQENGIPLDKNRAAACQLALRAKSGSTFLSTLKDMKNQGLSDIDAYIFRRPNQAR